MLKVFQYNFMINDTLRQENLSDLRFLVSKITSMGAFI